MTRMLGVVGALLLALLVLVPVAAADEFGLREDHVLLNLGGDVVLAAGQRADVLVVINGTATVSGVVREVIVVNGSVAFVGGRAEGLSIVRGRASLDATSVVSGELRTFDGSVAQAPGAVVGTPRDLRSNFGWLVGLFGPALVLLYVGLTLAAIAAGLVLAGLAGRQVRRAEALIANEPGTTIVASIAGFFGIMAAGVLAMVTIVGIPLGLGILGLALPILLTVGYLVAGIWIGDLILRRDSTPVARERPYLASVIGLTVLAIIGIVPFLGLIPAFLGFGAVVLLMWRTVRGESPIGVATERPLAGAVAS